MIDQYRCPKCLRLLFKVEVKRNVPIPGDVRVERIYVAENLIEYMNPYTEFLEVVCPKCNKVSAVTKGKLIEVGERTDERGNERFTTNQHERPG